MIARLADTDVTGKRVLVRVGMDMPLDEEGNVTDDTRIQVSLPTINYLLQHGAKQIILMCHIGRPKERSEKLSTTKTAQRLSELLGKPVAKVDDWGENGLPDDAIIFLENVRFNPAEKSKDELLRDEFGKQLAALADVFVQDAFSNCHHPEQASMTGVLPYIPGCLGLGPEREIQIINDAIKQPEKPFVSILGGMKAEKLNAITNLLGKVDHVLMGGALAFTMLKSLGKNVGNTQVDNEGLENLKSLVETVRESDKVMLPVDAVIAKDFEGETQVVAIDAIPDGWMALDIGPKTVEKYTEVLRTAKTVIFNGPAGVYEVEKFSKGTRALVQALMRVDGTTVVGGGDSSDAVKRFGDPKKITLVASGGGASLRLIEGKELGALTALEKNYRQFN